MGSEFTFYDYIDADGSGANVVKEWLNGQGRQAKAYFNRMISYLEASPPPGSTDSVWHDPYTKAMGGDWKDFVELRKTGRIQYRLIGKVESRGVFLVASGFHKGSYETDITPAKGKERVAQMKNNPAKYRREHDHS